MSFSFISSGARATWAAGTDQQAQLEALAALWLANVAIRYYTSGGTHLRTVTHAPWIIDTTTTPRCLRPGAFVAESPISDGTAAYCIAAVPSGSDILRADVSLGAISDPGGRVRLDLSPYLKINATSTLPEIPQGTLPDGSFFDDFLGTSILSSEWWVYDRLGDQSNSEAQSYKPSNVTVAGSILTLTARKEDYTVGDLIDAPALRNYTSGAVCWKTYTMALGGTIEIRARINCATARGAWAALWFMGYKGQDTQYLTAQDSGDYAWAAAGGAEEIDFVECKGGNATANDTLFNLYWGTPSPSSVVTHTTADTLTAWHTYKMVWDTNTNRRLRYYCDDVLRQTIENANVPSTGEFLMMNIALGGSGGAGSIVDADLPATMEIDWVRVTPA